MQGNAIDLTGGERMKHTNFGDAFADGAVFTGDGANFVDDPKVAVAEVARIRLRSGRVIASEPSLLDWPENQRAFTQTVRPGEYPVLLSEVVGLAPAAIMVRFSELPVVEWRMATRDEENIDDLGLGQIFAYGVDGGTGGFVDADAAIQLAGRSDWFDSTAPNIDQEMFAAFDKGQSYFALVLDESTGANVVGCKAGYGDGAYASYWGLDRNGDPAQLVTDFAVLVESAQEVRTIDRASVELDVPFDVDVLTLAAMSNVRLELDSEGDYLLRHEGASGLRAQLVTESGEVVADTISGGLQVAGIPPTYTKNLRTSENGTPWVALKLIVNAGVRPLQRIR